MYPCPITVNNNILLPKQLEYRNYKDCTLNKNDNMMPLHGHYTLQPRGVLTNDIGTAENFKLNKMVFFESHVREISTYLGGGGGDVHFSRILLPKNIEE